MLRPQNLDSDFVARVRGERGVVRRVDIVDFNPNPNATYTSPSLGTYQSI
jgi:hypothetical protein